MFGEGRRDKNFLYALISLKKFKDHTEKWTFTTDGASGISPKTILDQCRKSALGKSYDLIICFIDLDKLRNDYRKRWEVEQKKLEEGYGDITIIWQDPNAEGEMIKVLGDHHCGKHKLNKIAKQKVEKFINSEFWKKILKPIKDKESER
ncbi:MAG: hypothetical protein WC397_01550 [Candidatus Paceibacterota bacterium]|jgi:hypothetical protein